MMTEQAAVTAAAAAAAGGAVFEAELASATAAFVELAGQMEREGQTGIEAAELGVFDDASVLIMPTLQVSPTTGQFKPTLDKLQTNPNNKASLIKFSPGFRQLHHYDSTCIHQERCALSSCILQEPQPG